MNIETSVSFSGVPILVQFAQLSGKSFQDSLLQAARNSVEFAIKITPPASNAGVGGGLDSGMEAKRRGEAAIRRDLHHAFSPVKIKGKRKEKISSSDLVTIHRRLLAAKRPGSPMKRDRGQPYYVDVRKLLAYERDLKRNVGKLASGWVSAAQTLGARSVPAWVSRHGTGRGAVEVQLAGSQIFVTALNVLSSRAPAWVQPETQRRARKAQEYGHNSLATQLPHLMARDGRTAGLSAA